MAYAQPRSANAELDEGMTDGKYKKGITDRGGEVENGTWRSRADLIGGFYGIHEAPEKVTPDGLVVRTRNTVHTPCPEPEFF